MLTVMHLGGRRAIRKARNREQLEAWEHDGQAQGALRESIKNVSVFPSSLFSFDTLDLFWSSVQAAAGSMEAQWTGARGAAPQHEERERFSILGSLFWFGR